ncbi:MAG TPA: hypothetical protein PKA00_17500 [Saprospiraceae bacterium]|nr:hypothetical protein [Saprospiraceae bacterium]HMQ84717.1 hypothetical protein [Saprospiraceae bacterium]
MRPIPIFHYCLLAFTCLILVASCKKQEDDSTPEPNPEMRDPLYLQGRWERINSTFVQLDGMEILADTTTGIAAITSTPTNPYGFVTGDPKWINITRTSDSTYTFDDLVKETNNTNQYYVPGVIIAQEDNEELKMTFPTTGTTQQWRRKN